MLLEESPEERALWKRVMDDLSEAWRASCGDRLEPGLILYKFENPGRFTVFEIMWSRFDDAKKAEVESRIKQLGPYDWKYGPCSHIPSLIGVSEEDQDRWHIYGWSHRIKRIEQAGDLDAAESAWKEAVEEATRKFGDTFPQLAQAHIFFAHFFRKFRSDNKSFDRELQLGFEVYDRTLKQNPKNFTSAYRKELIAAARIYERRGELEVAERLFRRCLEINEAVVDELDQFPRTDPLEVAQFFERHGRAKDAEWAYLFSLDQIRIDEKHDGPYWSGCDNFVEVGKFYVRQNRPVDAERHFEKLLEIYEEHARTTTKSINYNQSFQWFAEYKELLQQQGRTAHLSKLNERVLLLEQRAGRKVSDASGYGYIDTDGNWVIRPRFIRASSFSNGIALVEIDSVVSKHKHKAFIDRSGNQLFKMDFPNAEEFRGDFACVSILDRRDRRVIDATGTILPKQFQKVFPFHEDLAGAEVGDSDPPLFGFIDREYKLVIPAKFTVIDRFEDGLAVAAIGGHYHCTGCTDHLDGCQFGVINRSGEFVIDPTFSKLKRVTSDVFDFRDEKNQRGGLIDRTGKIIVELPRPGDSWELSEGLIPFAWNCKDYSDFGNYGFIDLEGNIVIAPQFSFASPFNDGRALVSDHKGDDTTYGYIDKTGELVIPMQFRHAESFREGLAAVEIIENGNARWGFVGVDGQFVVPPKFERVEDFSEGLAAVQFTEDEGGKWGYIDKSGALALPAIYDSYAGSFENGRAVVTMAGNKKGIIDRSGKYILAPEYQSIGKFSEGLAAVCKEPSFNLTMINNEDGSISFHF